MQMDAHKTDILKYKRAVLNILINARATLIDRIRRHEAASAVAQISAAANALAKGSSSSEISASLTTVQQGGTGVASTTAQMQQASSQSSSSSYTASTASTSVDKRPADPSATGAGTAVHAGVGSGTSSSSSSDQVVKKEPLGKDSAEAAEGNNQSIGSSNPAHVGSQASIKKAPSLNSMASSGAPSSSSSGAGKKQVALIKTREMLFSQGLLSDHQAMSSAGPQLIRSNSQTSMRSAANASSSGNIIASSSSGAAHSRKSRSAVNQATSMSSSDAQQPTLQDSVGFNAQYNRYTSTDDGLKYENISQGVLESLRTTSLSGSGREDREEGYLPGENHSRNSYIYPPPLLPRNKGHWDYLMDEMQWMAVDFRQELRWKILYCKVIAELCSEMARLPSRSRSQPSSSSSSGGASMEMNSNVGDDSIITGKKNMAHKLSRDMTTFWKDSRKVILHDVLRAFQSGKAAAADNIVGDDDGVMSILSHFFSNPSVAPAVAVLDEQRQHSIDAAMAAVQAALDSGTSTGGDPLSPYHDTADDLVGIARHVQGLYSKFCGACVCGDALSVCMPFAIHETAEWFGEGRCVTVFLSRGSSGKWLSELQFCCPNKKVFLWDNTVSAIADGASFILVPFEAMADYVQAFRAGIDAGLGYGSGGGREEAVDVTTDRSLSLTLGFVIVDMVGVGPTYARSMGAFLDCCAGTNASTEDSNTNSTILSFIANHFITKDTKRLLLRSQPPSPVGDDSSGMLSFLLPQLKSTSFLKGWVGANEAKVGALLNRLCFNTELFARDSLPVEGFDDVEVVTVEMAPSQKLKYDFLLNKFMVSGVLRSTECDNVFLALSILKKITFQGDCILLDTEISTPASHVNCDQQLASDAMDVDESAAVSSGGSSYSGDFVACYSGNRSIGADSCKLSRLLQLVLSSASKSTNILVLVETTAEYRSTCDVIARSVGAGNTHSCLFLEPSYDYNDIARLPLAKKIVCVTTASWFTTHFSPKMILRDSHHFRLVIDVCTGWLSARADILSIKKIVSSAKFIQIVVAGTLDELRYSDVLENFTSSADSTAVRSLISSKEWEEYYNRAAADNDPLIYSNHESTGRISVTKIVGPAKGNSLDLSFTEGMIGVEMSRISLLCGSDKRRRAMLTHAAKAIFLDAKDEIALKNIESQFFNSNSSVANMYFDNQTITSDQRQALRRKGYGTSDAEGLLNLLVAPSATPHAVPSANAASSGASYGTFAVPVDAQGPSHVPAPSSSSHLAGRGVASRSGDESDHPLKAITASFVSILNACRKEGLLMDPTLYVNPLQTSLYSQVAYFPPGQQLSVSATEDLSIFYPTCKRGRSEGSVNGLDKGVGDAVSPIRNRRRTLETSGYPMDVSRVRLESGTRDLSHRSPRGSTIAPYTAVAAPMPAAGGSRWPTDAELATEPWSVDEDNIIVAVQLLFRDSTFSVSEHVLSVSPRAFGRIRSAKQIRDRCTHLLNKGLINLSDPAIVLLIEAFKAGSSRVEWAAALGGAGPPPEAAAAAVMSSPGDNDSTAHLAVAATATATASANPAVVAAQPHRPDFRELLRVTGVITSVCDMEPLAAAIAPLEEATAAAAVPVSSSTAPLPGVVGAFQLLSSMQD